ncbi:hypothetical protein [Streptomyces neyagawaensis]|uniref:hypothetical protein n=1 Tax=Streptomyces neyagawaensis TaxID=42238 RepID=UPI0006E15183|nr:hypothetical protein [Streptomyces neyagawaensis]MCL6738953.1 hypothetical protein [Streptomyces neyagawaensis]MDE1684359.1 hypothetical protein [Streptomyces neyagawaensis]
MGTDAALPVLARFRSHPFPPVRAQLAWTWHRFDTRRYAEEIIADFPRTISTSASTRRSTPENCAPSSSGTTEFCGIRTS